MAFKKIRNSGISAESPEALFRDLRNRQVEGLLSHQADLLREYCNQKFLKASDVAFQLPTGSGKTLMGLLIGEWRRRKYKERVIYLCPTRQLVNQVVAQSLSKYGIKANAFVGKRSQFSQGIKAEYINAETLAVTTYSGLFNTNSFFENPDIIILDDAHAAEDYIAKYWSLVIDSHKHNILFKALVSAFRDSISSHQYSRLLSNNFDPLNSQWIEKIPVPHVYLKLSELTAILNEHIKNTGDLKYSWSVIRDCLFACNIYISTRSILIRPVIPPTLTHQPFAGAKQRIYMSATLGEGGELERLSGIDKIERLSAPDGWDRQGYGRRLFLFPERSLDEQSALNLTIEMIKRTPRSLVLSPDERRATEFRNRVSTETDYKIFDATQIEKSKQTFITDDKAVAVVANRYDGIDLVGEECRLLVISGLQQALNLQEKFLVSRMPAGILFIDRIVTRIVQAFGRCTRSATDYAAVILLGEELNRFLLDKDRRPLFHPEIQAELEFGIEQSKDVREDDFLEYFNIFLDHKDEWNEVEGEIITIRDSLQQAKLPGIEKLKEAALHEVRYQYALWRSNFEKAVEECRSVVTALEGNDVVGYRAFWYYLAGSAAWMGAQKGIASLEKVSRDFFKRASSAAEGGGIPWLLELSRLNIGDIEENRADIARLDAVIEGLESQLLVLGMANDKKFESEVKFILENLHNSDPKASKNFEKAHEKLGRLIGYKAGNDESTAAPDPWWIAGDDFCIVFEDHLSESSKESSMIGANKVRQAASHTTWIKKKELVQNDAQIIPVMITPYEKIDKTAAYYTDDCCYWKLEEFISWAEKAISVVRSLRRSFPSEADLEWRKRAIQAYRDDGLDPASLAASLRSRKLADVLRNQ